MPSWEELIHRRLAMAVAFQKTMPIQCGELRLPVLIHTADQFCCLRIKAGLCA
jgi:hypothetical protein